MEWISIPEAIIRTQKGERTIRRWVKSQERNTIAIKKEAGKIYIKASILRQKYGFINDNIDDAKRQDEQKTSQMQIVSYSETIKELSNHLKIRDEEIKTLLNRKSKLPLGICIGFICAISFMLTLLYAYRSELIETHKEALLVQSEGFQREIQFTEKSYQRELSNIKEQTNTIVSNQSKTISNLEAETAQQREELAEKDRLISQLYNDTKKQNKKLLELTESLKADVIKNEQKENILPEKEAQK